MDAVGTVVGAAALLVMGACAWLGWKSRGLYERLRRSRKPATP